jgi:hypothetical protein
VCQNNTWHSSNMYDLYTSKNNNSSLYWFSLFSES